MRVLPALHGFLTPARPFPDRVDAGRWLFLPDEARGPERRVVVVVIEIEHRRPSHREDVLPLRFECLHGRGFDEHVLRDLLRALHHGDRVPPRGCIHQLAVRGLRNVEGQPAFQGVGFGRRDGRQFVLLGHDEHRATVPVALSKRPLARSAPLREMCKRPVQNAQNGAGAAEPRSISPRLRSWPTLKIVIGCPMRQGPFQGIGQRKTGPERQTVVVSATKIRFNSRFGSIRISPGAPVKQAEMDEIISPLITKRFRLLQS